MKLLLTGGTGFVGSHLVRRFSQTGHDVHLILRPRNRLRALDSTITAHEHDGSTVQMVEILKTCRPDAVIHVAALFVTEHTPEHIDQLVESNLRFPLQVIEAMAQAGVRRLINTGTAWQHFRNEAFNPVGLYAATKQAAQDLFRHYTELEGFHVVTLKLFDTYGPEDSRSKLMPILLERAKTSKPIALTSGEQKVDFVYIDDVTDAYIHALDYICSSVTPGMYEFAVSSGEPRPLRDVVELFCRVTGAKLPLQWGVLPYRRREVMTPWSNGQPLPGWKAAISLEEGFRRLWAWANQVTPGL